MSILIDRLAMKAMGVLESVQPVIQARYAFLPVIPPESDSELERRAATQWAPEANPSSIAMKRTDHTPQLGPALMPRSRDDQKKPPLSTQGQQDSIRVQPVSEAVGQQRAASASSQMVARTHSNASAVLPVQSFAHGRDANPAPAQPQQDTDIRIAIGTMEMRASHAENKQTAPAFRPRVSLDDFLNRKSDRQA